MGLSIDFFKSIVSQQNQYSILKDTLLSMWQSSVKDTQMLIFPFLSWFHHKFIDRMLIP